MSSGKPVSIKSKEQFKEVVNSSLTPLVVVMFTATWCRPCQQAYPEVRRQAITYKDDVVFATVDVDENEEIVQMCKVRAFPTFMFINEGKQLDFSIGAGMDLVEDKIRHHLVEIKKREREEEKNAQK